jgi:hypothetical protein
VNDPEEWQALESEDDLREFLLKRFLKDYYSAEDALFFAMEWARRGDWEPLAVYLELGGLISDKARAFLVAVLRGEKKPNNRAPSSIASIKSAFRADFVLNEERHGQKREHAINKAADVFEVDRRTIQRDLKEWQDLMRH